MTKKKQRRGTGDQFTRELIERMEQCPNAESLNRNVLMPFVSALEAVCEARGYMLNIYGEKSNIVFTNDDYAPVIYDMVEAFLDAQEEEEGDNGADGDKD